MNVTSHDPKVQPGDLGSLLRYWRDVRGVSQLDLSLEAGISQRQISFIESGRSVPGRDTLLTLAQTLDVPLRERNALLLAAGYAPIYSEAPWNAQEMHGVVRALERVVRQHEPFPALVMDRDWNVLMTNDAAPRFFNCFIDMTAREGPAQHAASDLRSTWHASVRRRVGGGRAKSVATRVSRVGRSCNRRQHEASTR
ncbi:transcriptional regulator with XRE-family HTH domain [Paraburkholderia sp. UCT70]